MLVRFHLMMAPRIAADDHVVRLDLNGRTALVTGAGNGIGAAVAIRLAAAGAKLVLVAVAERTGGLAVTADLADPAAVELLDAGIDVIVNNAGVQHVAPIEDFPPERFAYIQQVMVDTPFRLVRRVLPHMYERGWGRVVNISSVHGLRASAYKVAYVAAKHALEGMTKVVAVESAGHGVTANCVNPAYVRTALVQNQVAAQAASHGISEADVVEKIMLARSAIKRLIEPAEVAELVAYLCSPAASYITGASIAIDGGWTAQ
jgi:3-hydroxybutyrate dehydrogenase